MRHYIVEDTSFLLALLDKEDKFHRDALKIFRLLLKYKDFLKVVLPSVVIYEGITSLLRKGYPYQEVENKIINLLHIEELIVVNLPLENAFRICKRLPKDFGIEYKIATIDWLIIGCGIDFEAQVLTFDKKLLKRVKRIYPYVYYCSKIDNEVDDTQRFMEDLEKTISCLRNK